MVAVVEAAPDDRGRRRASILLVARRALLPMESRVWLVPHDGDHFPRPGSSVVRRTGRPGAASPAVRVGTWVRVEVVQLVYLTTCCTQASVHWGRPESEAAASAPA